MRSSNENRSEYGIIDLFAGPGGWDEGLAALGRGDVVGVEWCADACETAREAGHTRMQADVAELRPEDFGTIEGLIASPPCQAWSSAGKRGADFDRPLVAHVLEQMAAGRDVRAQAAEDAVDPRSILVAEPLRWALALRPQWIACEQVADALEAWEWTARHLEAAGYSTWTGVLSAERFGVPQTRRRAILIARLDRRAEPPVPTHQEYRPGEAAAEQHTFDGVLRPWVSFAEALGWEPDLIIDSGQNSKGPGGKLVRYVRPVSAPAPTVTSKTAGQWTFHRPSTTVMGDPRISPPGWRGKPSDYVAGEYVGKRSMDDAIKVSPSEAGVLQGFRPDYPWSGTKTSQHQQAGNAVPPPLAAAVLHAAGAVHEEVIQHAV